MEEYNLHLFRSNVTLLYVKQQSNVIVFQRNSSSYEEYMKKSRQSPEHFVHIFWYDVYLTKGKEKISAQNNLMRLIAVATLPSSFQL
jgi:hypothetical protein